MTGLYLFVETLRRRVREHGPSLRQSKALTRYVLIDPLVRELGWDTEDPGQVVPDYRSATGSTDYALVAYGRLVMMIQARELESPAADDGLEETAAYSHDQGADYLAVTDGRHWEVFDTSSGPLDRKPVVSFDLADPSPSNVVLQVLALWRPSLETGTVAFPSLLGAPQ